MVLEILSPDVGIVMPVYVQRHDYLRIALSTMLAQAYRNFVLVVVIDGAPDDIVGVVEEETRNDPRVEILVKKTNEGTAKALNTGFERLMQVDSVKYLTWVSSDNLHYPSFLEELREPLLCESESLGLSYSNYRCIDAAGNVIVNLQPEKFMNYPKEWLIDGFYIGAAFMYKKRFAKLIDGYRMEPVEDFDYWLRLTEVCDIHYVPRVLMEYRYGGPLSRTMEIDAKKELKQEWRYMLNVARCEARERRGIATETTIIFPIGDAGDGTRETVEELLHLHYYTNFKLLIADLGAQLALASELEGVRDPRMSWVSMSADRPSAIRALMREADTPFTLLYRAGCIAKRDDALAALAAAHHALGTRDSGRVISTYYYDSTTEMSLADFARRIRRAAGTHIAGLLRIPTHPLLPVRETGVAYKTQRSEQEPVFGELYRTDCLLDILKIRRREA